MAEDTLVLDAAVEESAEAEDESTNAETEDIEEPETLTREQAIALAEERAASAVAEKEQEWKAQVSAETYKREVQVANRELGSAVFARVDNLLGWAAKKFVEEGKSLAEVQQERAPEVIERIVNPLLAAAFSQQWQEQGNHFDSYVQKVAPDWKPSVTLAKSMENALASRDPNLLIKARWDYMADAIRSAEVPKGVAEALKAEKEKAKPGKAVAKMQGTDAVIAAQRLPTTGGGSAAPIGLQLTNKQIEELPVSTWNSYSAEQREKILNNPKRWS